MARAPDIRIEQARQMFLSGKKLIEISEALGVPEGTVRSWKNRYKWGNDSDATLQTDKRNVAKKKNDVKIAVADEVKDVMKNTDLTDKQQLFCIYYIRCFNATKAYQKAYGVDYTTAASIGYRLLENDGVKSEILRLKQERLNREFLSESDIFQKYMDIAFADITDFTEFGNEEVEVTLDNGEKRTITVSHVNVRNSSEVDGTIISEISKGKDGVKVKLADRMKALQWLTDHMDMATEKQRAEIAALRARAQGDDDAEVADDGFLEALNGAAVEDWSDEED